LRALPCISTAYMSFLHRATFFTTAASMGNLVFPSAGEVAFAGRSNAGKSSAINTLANQRRLAFTSKTPGRTQQLNYFGLGEDKFLVDLPGYGYAKVQKTEQARWRAFLGQYLQNREPLAGLVLIMDSRHPLTELDRQMLEWFAPRGRPVHVLLTKADKLGRAEQSRTLAAVRRELAVYDTAFDASLFSSLKKTGKPEIEAVLARWLGIEMPPAKKLAAGNVGFPPPATPLEY
jgi:GTP-binding protein